MKKIKLAIGSDHAGFELKEHLKNYLSDKVELLDMGCFDTNRVDYPLIAKKVAQKVASKEAEKGIIVCGSGLGVCITANKTKGIRAVTCSEPISARLSRQHNDANILTLGGRLIGSVMAEEIVDVWLSTEFEGERHQKRIDMIED